MAMVSCPCVDGLSHNEAKEIMPEWAADRASVPFRALVETVEVVG
jgi:N-carbamoyl-L-amino-acid hydrolase